MIELKSKIKKALELLEKFEKWRHKFVFFSGGKDSLVALDLASKVWKDFTIVYAEVTGNTHPKCTKYAYKIADEYNADFVHVKAERYEFFERLEKWGYPPILDGYTIRWCMNHFKCIPIAMYTKGRGVGVSGIKPSDSNRRFRILSDKYPPIIVDPAPRSRRWSYYSLKPLYWFNKADIWQYIALNNLEVNPLYKEIGFSGNCMICPAMNKDKFIAVMEKCPEFFYKWKRVHEKLRASFEAGKPIGMRKVFYDFDKWYVLYCQNKRLVEYAEALRNS